MGVIVKEPEAQAQLLNEFYDAVFRTDAGQPISTLPIPSVMMGTFVFTPCLVHKELSTLATSRSPGPDQLYPKLLKWLTTFLTMPLEDLCNNSILTVVVPSDWKVVVICPIFTMGEREDVAIYRPVSLSSLVCKVFERI